MTNVFDVNGEPFEIRCKVRCSPRMAGRGSIAKHTRAGLRATGLSVRASFSDWDFGIIEKYGGALDLQPDQVSN